jgi:hypothetical protein
VTSTLETGVPVGAGVGRPVLVVFDQVSAYQTRVLEGIRAVLTAMRVPLIVYCKQQGRDRVVSRTDAASPDGHPERPRPSATR